ncbi:MAG: TraR/DksA C4-type zinc finger protein [Chloroflexi bacterium]|nr:TraR/DksA C4-type zinc finger protein [Chloroflexota bacterium]
MKSLSQLLEESAALHRHLCPRQVLGARIGMLAGDALGLDLPQTDKRLLTIVETDGCAADGISTVTNCWVGRRTLRVEDYGKVAATFIDTATGQAVRIIPQLEARTRARIYALEARNKWEAQLLGYQRMPAEELLSIQPVSLKVPVEQIVSRPGLRAVCEVCGEEIMNEREIVREGVTLCRACAGESYYLLAAELPHQHSLFNSTAAQLSKP